MITLALCCFGGFTIFGQDQKIADSLKLVYNEDDLEGVSKLELLHQLSFNEINDHSLSLKYADELITLSKDQKDLTYLYKGYENKGNAHRLLGNLNLSLDAYFKAVETAEESGRINENGVALMAVADVYSEMGNSGNARKYYALSIEMLRNTDDSVSLATALLNAGDDAFQSANYTLALEYFQESGKLFEELDYVIGTAYNLGNAGMVYAELGNDARAEENINEAIDILEGLQDYYAISVYLNYMSDIYLRKNDWNAALIYANRSLVLAEKHNLKDQISEASLTLFELYEKNGRYKESLPYLKNYYNYRDSVRNIEIVEQMADLRTDYEVSKKQAEVVKKQAEVNLLSTQRKNQQLISLATGIGLLLIFIVSIGLYRRNKFISKTKAQIENEKKRSDELLLNILPEETANELKENGKVEAKRFESVTVMFTDFKGFSALSDKLSPEELVKSVDYYYSKFDEIIDRQGLEKIKTVGDAYMCAGGLPYPTDDHAIKAVQAACEILEFVRESRENDPDDMTRFDIRIGINTGTVVAGIVGTKKFAYDIWGDTVNIASRMESNSEPMKINVSESTFSLIENHFRCSYRGEIEAKNKGKLKMYFVEDSIC